MTRVALVQVEGGEGDGQGDVSLGLNNESEPLGIECLEAWLLQEGVNTYLAHPRRESSRYCTTHQLERQVREFEPDLVCFSAMTNQIPETVLLAEELRRELKNVPFVVGGDHFSSYIADLANYPVFDFAVRGEGEAVLSWIVRHLDSMPGPDEWPSGLYVCQGGELIGRGVAERIGSLDDLPNPSRHEGLIRNSRVGALMWPRVSEQTGLVSLYASRGCPYSCSYCDARQVWGKGVTWRSTGRILSEVQEVTARYAANTGFFVDLTFNSDRAKVMEICGALGDLELDFSWYVLLRPGNPNDRIGIDREMLAALRRAGCIKVGMGVESIDQGIGKELRRPVAKRSIFDTMKWCDEEGLLTKVFLIIGHPSETLEYYQSLHAYLQELGADEVRISFLTPFPGTALWHVYRDQISGTSYEDFTTFRPILPHPIFSKVDLGIIRTTLLTDYYTSGSYQRRLETKIRRHPHLEGCFEDFLAYVRRKLAIDEREVGVNSRMLSAAMESATGAVSG